MLSDPLAGFSVSAGIVLFTVVPDPRMTVPACWVQAKT